MPLHKGKSSKVFKENVKEMYESGHPLNQSLAAAYSEKRKSEGSKMKKQSHKDKMDESLGERHGKESKHKQSMKDRCHESEGMKKKKK